MGDPSVTLPTSVENFIVTICTERRVDPPDSWARRRLATVDEGVATAILSKIYNQRTQIRDLSRLIVWFIDNPQSPVRAPAQRRAVVNPQSPYNNHQVQSSQSPVGYPHRSPSNSPFQNDQSLARHPHRSNSDNHAQGLAVHPHQNPPYGEGQSRQSLFGHDHQNPSYISFQDAQNFNEHSLQNLLNNQAQDLVGHPHPTPSSIPSPCGRGSPSLCDLDHAAAASFPSEDNENSSFHLCKNSTSSLLPCSHTASSNRTNRQLNFCGEPQIKEGLDSSIPSHCTHSNPSPCEQGSSSFCDHVHVAAASSFPSASLERSLTCKKV